MYYYWYSIAANMWYVMDDNQCIWGYDSGVALRKDYPSAECVPCNDKPRALAA